jgi:enediyne polyketide synthase
MTKIAVVGMACRYPDASSPAELWENAIAGRRAFRRMPDVRTRLEDYWDADPATPDRFYAKYVAVLEGYEFDRISYKIAGSTYRSTDLTHWLALDTAARALTDAGFPLGENLPRERTGVVVGNTLTGEFTRANVMRLRWPYIRRTIGAALSERGWNADQLATFLDDLETSYKNPFPAIDEDTLAGGLSNTIAGRICNYFDLKGGGYTVDGACASSLLSVTTAAKALLDGDLDVAIAGGVDLSLDPFELVGFAKTGALARDEMRVYDRDSNGFWPGEGCGMVVLMRAPDAAADGRRTYATIAGWGISSDGKGGITRPEIGGYSLALQRAYERAGFSIDTVALFEGHGTGTEVGDRTELTALSQTRRLANPAAAPAAIGTVKGIIGHTKAAAGAAGLIKALMAVYTQVLPPTVGCVHPHPLLTDEDAALRVLPKAEPWPQDMPVRAGITAMGFGGINTHVVLDGSDARKPEFNAELASSVQDAELLLVDASSPDELRVRLRRILEFVPHVSYAQLSDLAAAAQRELRNLPYRAALIVSSPHEAQQQLQHALDVIESGRTSLLTGQVLLGHADGPGRIGYLFPGQGSGQGTSGGALLRRFAEVEEIYVKAALPSSADMIATEVAQPRIVTGSAAGLRALSLLGLEAQVAVGHSLGELSALSWAGALDTDTLLRVATVRGRTMAAHSASGTMAGIAAAADQVKNLVGHLQVVIAGYNGPGQTVIAGPVDAVEEAGRRVEAAGLIWNRIPISHAFHSPLVAPAASVFGRVLNAERFNKIERTVISTVTGTVLSATADIPELLRRQITEPVLFAQALEQAAEHADLLIEVGPGKVLSGLASAITDVPAVALDTDSESLSALLRVAGAAYVTGASIDLESLFHGRLLRPLEIGAKFSFLASPCEQAPSIDIPEAPRSEDISPDLEPAPGPNRESNLEMLRRMAAERAELPSSLVLDTSRLLDDLHLSSITVGQIMNRAALQLGLPASQVPANFATATLTELAAALGELGLASGEDGSPPPAPEGAATWTRPFAVNLVEQPLPTPARREDDGRWQLYAPTDHPLAGPLRDALEHAGVGSGVLVCLPADCTEKDLEFALQGAKAASPSGRFVLLQHGLGAAALARTLHLEIPQLRVTILQAPTTATSLDWAVAEVNATTTFSEAHYDSGGVRRVPMLCAMPVRSGHELKPLNPTDVLLVTGGGKGITAECAFDLASWTGATLGILGRSDPADDAELSANLERMAAAGVQALYVQADVTDAGQVERAVGEVTRAFGQVTAILHGAGRNEPTALAGLEMEAFRQTFAPKIDGLRAVLEAVDPARLRLLVTFGSIIGRAGLRGEAHYAAANEWLAARTQEVATRYPQCRCLCMEWSVWSGVGMGERLSVVELLTREGIVPVPPDEGVKIMRRLLADPQAPVVVVISGRTGTIDTVRYDLPKLPLLRFAEKPVVRYHGVELITEIELNAGTDLYLADHELDGNLLFPAVFGMEAMAQVAIAVTGRHTELPMIEQAEFLRPIVVPPDGTTTIQVAAVVTDADEVQVSIRSAETGFAAEHFRARLRFAGGDAPEGPPHQTTDGLPVVPLDPATDLYGSILFQGRRFHRLRRYHRASAWDVDADVIGVEENWFAGFLPQALLLGDPGVRDALMHGNQVCVPDATLLPIGVDRVYPGGERLIGDLRYCATERHHEGSTYVYDVAVRTSAGEIVERWEGLRLRAVRKTDGKGPWNPALLASYLERTLEDLTGARVAIAVEPHGRESHREQTQLAAGRALGRPASLRYRPDGRPETDTGQPISASHGPGLTICVTASGPTGCDVESVTAREWTGLLGPYETLAKLIAVETGEDWDTTATRVWAATECLQKAGKAAGAPLTLDPPQRAEWVTVSSGALTIATFATTLQGITTPLVFAILAERQA